MDKVFATAGIWALGADEVQWILYRAKTRNTVPFWNPVLYVSSTREVLKERMREAGVERAPRENLLEGLPDTFRAWKTHSRAF